VSDIITVRDVLTTFAARPSHPPVDAVLADLRIKADEAWRAYYQAVDERIYIIEQGGEPPDLSDLLDAAEGLDVQVSARWKELQNGWEPASPGDYRMASSDAGWRKVK